ncbi:nuclear transport factor 2 family protein [Frankia sp. Mgl5]|uniref:Gamma-BHC dehydrochlorinase n=1 Tax=Parafrankia soli TaxID=2599596 RepID=A0A1S1Q025_9ACTN|nr:MULTISPECIES: nuclear transport factor 2 family protein [Frankiaceae]ABW14082.1 gamma-BHC dehydrochlorinase [Frankia sp. EAN1pec]CAI7976577.1 Gamma-BHC dehydrochlorinase [Frankia sp. Hr75.2]MCK9928928.1 nuclear transport factor 2 family protein [Frankia sp. Mgl5]OHV26442.1 gamma-BHC dehydrochlorinase [Parafrankia soli]TCJ37766.1 nuclear transport factor 2 family protein [Parafrankia sp. BMG5.11]
MRDIAGTEQAAIQQLLDKQAIREATMRYCRGVDRCDPDLISSAYHPDAIDDHGDQRYSGRTVGRGVADLVRSAKVSMNQVTNQLITLHDDRTAGCETYFTVWRSIETEGEDRVLLAIGRYIDRFERREGEWKIAHRLVIVDLTHVVPASGLMRPSRPGLGSRDRNDPSYAALESPDTGWTRPLPAQP